MLFLTEPPKVLESRFVITEDEAYFYPVSNNKPNTMEMINQIFDLNDMDVFRDVSKKLVGGEIVKGYYDPSIRQFKILGPVEPTEEMWERIVEVFEDWTN